MKTLFRAVVVLIFLSSCNRDKGTETTAVEATAPQVTAPQIHPSITFETLKGPLSVKVEVVHTPATIQRGLMYRKHLAVNQGMLFVFSTERQRSFWMKNTLIPLDMFFVQSDMTIAGIVENTEPLTLTPRNIDESTQYVIEMNGGWAKANQVRAGSTIKLSNLPTNMNPPL